MTYRQTDGRTDGRATMILQGDKYAAFLHDAVLLYAIALNETYRKGQDVNSGIVVARNCRGKTFRGLPSLCLSISYSLSSIIVGATL